MGRGEDTEREDRKREEEEVWGAEGHEAGSGRGPVVGGSGWSAGARTPPAQGLTTDAPVGPGTLRELKSSP